MLSSIVLITIIFFLSKLFSLFFSKNIDNEKISAYECGFDPFEDARLKFDIQFYLIAILFIIFDLEIAFLFPWVICLSSLGSFGLVVMVIFLALLGVGFIYEWKKGALDW
jgi:NADH-quinone oxidoreductase subunit A